MKLMTVTFPDFGNYWVFFYFNCSRGVCSSAFLYQASFPCLGKNKQESSVIISLLLILQELEGNKNLIFLFFWAQFDAMKNIWTENFWIFTGNLIINEVTNNFDAIVYQTLFSIKEITVLYALFSAISTLLSFIPL